MSKWARSAQKHEAGPKVESHGADEIEGQPPSAAARCIRTLGHFEWTPKIISTYLLVSAIN
jgi:hypothetical protein